MIYYSNVSSDKPHMTFVGRWTPFHNGHVTLINTKRAHNPDLPVLILVRSTNFDKYQPHTRAEMIKMWMIENRVAGTVMIIPDVEGVYWGRGVGYKLEKVEVDEATTQISATKIREGIANKNHEWKEDVASAGGVKLLNPVTVEIVESGMVIWLTGCPSAGKTTIAGGLAEKIKSSFPFLKIQLLDGDMMRNTPISEGLGFSEADRSMHIRRMGQLARMFADHGILVICAFISPNRKVRGEIKREIGNKRFREIFVKASKNTRVSRDIKGLYSKAIGGKIANLTGYNATYQKPLKPFLVCDTDHEIIEESINRVFEKIFG